MNLPEHSAPAVDRTMSSTRYHLICERDVGLFSLIQQVVANIPWAFQEGRIPIVLFQDKTCYWTSRGYHDRNTVWEYYFEPVVANYPASRIPPHIRRIIADRHPCPFETGYFGDEHTFVSNHFGDHPDLEEKALSIPYLLDDPEDELRQKAQRIISAFVRPRDYVTGKAHGFYQRHMRGHYVIGLHARGTDATSRHEVRPHRQGSLVLSKYAAEVDGILALRPNARIFVATDAWSSLNYFKQAFKGRVLATDSVRHESGEAAGQGPTGWIMPAYVAANRERAARNGEEAVVDYLLLSQCDYLIHNGSSLARTVLLNKPELPHHNTHRGAENGFTSKGTGPV